MAYVLRYVSISSISSNAHLIISINIIRIQANSHNHLACIQRHSSSFCVLNTPIYTSLGFDQK